MTVVTSTDNFQTNIFDDVIHRAVYTWLRDAFVACGWVQTADTGQINLATATRPSALTYPSYMMFRMDDALQSTVPVFLKIEPGSGTSQGLAAMRFTVGQATNGAGVISGNSTGAFTQANTGTVSVTTDKLMRASGAPNRFVAAMWIPSPTTPAVQGSFVLSIERTHAVDGSDTADGVMVYMKMTNTDGSAQPRHMVVQPPGVPNGLAAPSVAPVSTLELISSIRGTSAGAFPVTPSSIRPILPAMNLLAYYNNDFASFVPVTINHFGTGHTYLPLGNGGLSGVGRANATNNDASAGLMRWE